MSIDYLMEDRREGARLAAKVDADGWINAHLADLLRPGDQVLDVGAGPMVVAASIASRFPGTRVVAVDGSHARLADPATVIPDPTRTLPVCADAEQLPLRDGRFDVVYCRLVLQYLAGREDAIREMVRVVRPGGLVVLYDLDGQLVWHDPPLDPALRAAIDEVLRALASTGFDPHTGRELFHLAHRCGLTDITVKVTPYHLIAGRIDEQQRRQWALKLDILAPKLRRVLGARRGVDAVNGLLDHLDRPDTLTYSIAFAVTGRRPPGDG